ncbi:MULTISPECIES: isochorismate synthase DhbC [Bacillus]|uniref:isochorismate synthase DhbC n=1 Tax=Bacillus TaxID=1386 RepID=UPI000A5026BF|nr:isochorismate synthase DhbC [Bacillus glycinifermentans]MBU8787673.1 isochorismate synthase DhbC [Bacillus glycinifermentans]NUJ17915.1 isochorismate synthase DhbC [Bacillus glycinifermentans]
MIDHRIAQETPADQLLREYRPDAAFFFSSPERTILAKGVFAEVPEEGGHRLEHLAQQAASILKDAEQSGRQNPIIVGAVPFDETKPAQLTVPNEVWCAGPLTLEQDAQIHPGPGPAYDIEPIPQPGEYMRGVEKGLARIAEGDVSKIVLSRSLRLTSPASIDISHVLCNLAQHNPGGYTFAVDLSKQAAASASAGRKRRRTLIGASPELLVSRKGLHVYANPLAGSRPRSDDPVEDRRRADELLSSSKDRHEHAVVTEAVASGLKPFCRTLDVPREPSLISTETMWHLSTEIKGVLTDASISSLELAAALQPTPAVCGTPTDAARAAIKEIEPFARGFFTGMVGWCDASGDGEWVVTIRCAEAEERALQLFAGAGIVAGSRPEDELAETSAKFRTMLLAMGLNNE